MNGYGGTGTKLKLLCYHKRRRFYYYTKSNIRSLGRSPFLTPLPFSRRLLISKYDQAMLRQTRMNPAKGIIIGAVNRLQLNKWRANGLVKGRF